MELIPKQGYVFVELGSIDSLALHQGFLSGSIVSGIKEVGMVVFFKDSLEFSGNLRLVKVDDILAWIKPEAKEEASEVVSA